VKYSLTVVLLAMFCQSVTVEQFSFMSGDHVIGVLSSDLVLLSYVSGVRKFILISNHFETDNI